MARKKFRTNNDAFKDLAKMDSVHTAILRCMFLDYLENNLKNKEAILANKKVTIIAPQLTITILEEAHAILKFEDS